MDFARQLCQKYQAIFHRLHTRCARRLTEQMDFFSLENDVVLLIFKAQALKLFLKETYYFAASAWFPHNIRLALETASFFILFLLHLALKYFQMGDHS